MPRWGRRTPTRHAQKSAWMRTNPFAWLEVATYPATYTAVAAASAIGGGTDGMHIARHYGPAGAFETRTTTVDDGTTIHARYVGGPLA